MTSEEYKEQLSEALGKLAGVHAVGDTWITFDGSIPAGGVPFTGQLVTRAMYADLWAWVQANKTVVTDAEWQTTASAQNGMNAAYSSGDGSTTFRLPCVVGGYLQAGDTSTAGQYVKEGLPNITGDTVFSMVADNSRFYGALTPSGQAAYHSGVALDGGTGLGFNASYSNTIYGNSQHVTPETFKVMVGVYAFGVTGTVGESTEAGLVAEMNRKADIDASNFSAAGKNVLAGMGMPKEVWVDISLGAAGTMYTVQKSGFIYARAMCTAIGGFFEIYTESRIQTIQGTSVGNMKTMLVPIRKGEVYKINYANVEVEYFRFIYAEGATD